MAIRGLVHGGQQPVAGATIQLYAAGSTGNESASIAMLSTAITSNGQGEFDLSGEYHCGEASDGSPLPGGSNQVYAVATGGNPGLVAGTDNKALVLMAALGTCANLETTSYLEINEVTTVAAAWALAPFLASYDHLGASFTNPDGITNAFLDAGLLADTKTGLAATLPANLSVETGKLYALANAVAGCVNSDGTTGCNKLFSAATPKGGTAPNNTLTAALNIVRHPGQNVVAVYNAASGAPPFVSDLVKAPNDWTMSLTVTGGGLASPTALGIDAQSNVWVAGQDGPLSGFGPQGAPLSPTGFGLNEQGETYITQVYGLAVDILTGDIWVTNYNSLYNGHGSVTRFYGSTSATPGAIVQESGYYDSSIFYPTAIASDTNGNLFIANNDSSSATVYDSSGNLVYAALGSSFGIGAYPLAIAVDQHHGFWLSDNDSTIAHIGAPDADDPNGVPLSHPTCCNTSHGVATDESGKVWVANYLGASVSEVADDGSVLIDQAGGGGIDYPGAVAIDGAQNVWLANFGGATISEIAGNGGLTPAGTALSPNATMVSPGGYGLDVQLVEPSSAAPDRAGNVWVANQGNDNVVMFFGLAAPTLTPVRPKPESP